MGFIVARKVPSVYNYSDAGFITNSDVKLRKLALVVLVCSSSRVRYECEMVDYPRNDLLSMIIVELLYLNYDYLREQIHINILIFLLNL